MVVLKLKNSISSPITITPIFPIPPVTWRRTMLYWCYTYFIAPRGINTHLSIASSIFARAAAINRGWIGIMHFIWNLVIGAISLNISRKCWTNNGFVIQIHGVSIAQIWSLNSSLETLIIWLTTCWETIRVLSRNIEFIIWKFYRYFSYNWTHRTTARNW